MTGTYNIDFLVASLMFLLVIFYHFITQQKLYNSNNRFFLFLIIIAIADIFFDIETSILIMKKDESITEILKASLTVFYMLQALIPYQMIRYTESLKNCPKTRIKKVIRFWQVPFGIMEIMVILNYWNGMIFYFEDGIYSKGSLYLLVYIYAIVCEAYIAVSSIIQYKELGEKRFRVVWEYLMISVSCVLVQAFTGDILAIGLGIGIGTMVLYITINNPYGYIDSLTGAFDNTYFVQWVQEEMDAGRQLNLIGIEMCQLKRINKVYGISTGDQLLAKVVKELQELDNSVNVFRISGKRLLLVTHTLAEYEKIRFKVQKLFESYFTINGTDIYFPVVIGGITKGEKLKTSDRLLAYIEYMVSLAPNSETTIVVQDDRKTMEGFQYEQEIEYYLKSAIEEDLFEVYYQPVYSIEKSEFVTLEALSRLRHPRLGMVAPDIFINIAEKSGQIGNIGYLQFKKICRFVSEHEEIMDKIQNVKVNLSPVELLNYEHCRKMIDVIREYGLPFSYFQFEITETVATEYIEELYKVVSEFQKIGVELCLDDFGSGYANLNTILRLPFSSIKLDRSLLKGICEDSQIASFYKNIVAILQSMGYKVVSEGVETEEEMSLLSGWGVDMIQGYYFSKPLSEHKIVELLKNQTQRNSR